MSLSWNCQHYLGVFPSDYAHVFHILVHAEGRHVENQTRQKKKIGVRILFKSAALKDFLGSLLW